MLLIWVGCIVCLCMFVRESSYLQQLKTPCYRAIFEHYLLCPFVLQPLKTHVTKLNFQRNRKQDKLLTDFPKTSVKQLL